DIVAGAFWLARSVEYFPPGTVHVAVVDPGVGSERAALLVVARRQFFVGPDNGLLSSLAATPDARIFRIDPAQLGLPPASRTFHGRDVFAPIAGRLAAGRLDPEASGPRVRPKVADPVPKPVYRDGLLCGEVVVTDRFGNALTNLEAGSVSNARAV